MNKIESLISVIMPVRNAGRYLEDAVASILNQSYLNIELILVDDHSVDNAIELLPGHLSKDIRLKRFISEGHGVVAAMATGYRHSQGMYLARMDADDIALPWRLEKQFNFLQQFPEIDIAGGQIKIIAEAGIDQGFLLYEQWLNSLCSPDDIERELFIESPIPNPTAFFRRECYEALNGYHDSEWAEDYDIFLRAHAAGFKMGKPEGVLLQWRDHDKRLTHCDSRYENKLFMKAKAYYLAHSDYFLENRKAIIWGTGPTGIYFHDILTSHNVEVISFIDVNPRRVGGIKRGLPVYHFTEIKEYTRDKDALIVGAVGARGARKKMRQALVEMGKEEGMDFLFAA